MQIVPHDRVTETCRDICLACPCGFCRCYGSLDKDRAAFAKLRRILRCQGKRSELTDRDSHTCSLLFHKRAGSCRTDLVHLEISHFPVFQGDKFGILAADLKDSVCLRVPVDSRFCLRCDLIPDRICAHHPSDTFTTGTGDADSCKFHFPETLPDACKSFPYHAFRITGSTEILEINDVSLPVCKDQVCTCGTDINTECTAVLRDHTGHFRLIETGTLGKNQLRKKGFLHLFSFFCTQKGFGKFPTAKKHLLPVFYICFRFFKIAFAI